MKVQRITQDTLLDKFGFFFNSLNKSSLQRVSQISNILPLCRPSTVVKHFCVRVSFCVCVCVSVCVFLYLSGYREEKEKQTAKKRSSETDRQQEQAGR